MSYSYDRTRTKTARSETWGGAVVGWMSELLHEMLRDLPRNMERTNSVSRLTRYGWMAELKGYSRADLEFTGAISASWHQGKVLVDAWIDDPQRGRTQLLKESLDFNDNIDGLSKKLVSQLAAL